jgi:hypothetical protein
MPSVNHATRQGYRRFCSHSLLYLVGRGVEFVSVSRCTLVEVGHGACLQCKRILRSVAVIAQQFSSRSNIRGLGWFRFELHIVLSPNISTRRDTVAKYARYHHYTYPRMCANFCVSMCPVSNAPLVGHKMTVTIS